MQMYPFPPPWQPYPPTTSPKSTLTDNNTQEIHGNTNGSFLEKGHCWKESIFGNEVEHRYNAGKRHWQEHSDTQHAIFLGIPQLEEGHNDTSTTNHRGEDHVAHLWYRVTVKAIVFSDEYRCRNEDSDANVILHVHGRSKQSVVSDIAPFLLNPPSMFKERRRLTKVAVKDLIVWREWQINVW